MYSHTVRAHTHTDDDAAGYLDVDMVDLLDKDFQIMANIRKLSNTTRDKLVFTVRFTLSRSTKRTFVVTIFRFS